MTRGRGLPTGDEGSAFWGRGLPKGGGGSAYREKGGLHPVRSGDTMGNSQEAGSTHHTEMRSCYYYIWDYIFNVCFSVQIKKETTS